VLEAAMNSNDLAIAVRACAEVLDRAGLSRRIESAITLNPPPLKLVEIVWYPPPPSYGVDESESAQDADMNGEPALPAHEHKETPTEPEPDVAPVPAAPRVTMSL
jgi:hypothetical protein